MPAGATLDQATKDFVLILSTKCLVEEFYWLLQISLHEVTFANFKPTLTGWRALARQSVNALEVPIGALHANCVAFLGSSSALSFPRMLQWLGRQAVSI